MGVACALLMALSVGNWWQTAAQQPTDTIPSAEGIAFFEKNIRPILIQYCSECHGGTKAAGGLSLDTRQGWKRGGDSGHVIVEGNPDASLLIQAVNYQGLEMPPVDHGGKLPEPEIALLTQWIAMGAPDPRDGSSILGGMDRETAGTWWAFQPLPESTDAVSMDPMTAARYIDGLLHAMPSEKGWTEAPQADKRTLIRRVTYDLTGLPPSPGDVEAFMHDTSPDAYANLIERLLSSPQYGVHWGRHWLDVVRYADTAGENTDRPLQHAWRYRNWVMDAIQNDMPFDRFVRYQVAGDVITRTMDAEEQLQGIVATGYLAIARRFGHDIDNDMFLTYEDLIDNLGKNFLGMTLGCARCHDHKYDPVTAEDYYALYGVFESTKFSYPGCEPNGQPKDMVPLIAEASLTSLQAAYQQQLAEYEERVSIVPKTAKRLFEISSQHTKQLQEAQVAEGQVVSLVSADSKEPFQRAMKRGETLVLTILPNANHGADTTQVELNIEQKGASESRVWSTQKLLDEFVSQRAPAIEQDGAWWYVFDSTDGPTLLREKKTQINGQPMLNGWGIGDTPSSIVNSSNDPVEVWTKLAPRSFFLHPGVNRNVSLAWVCPADGVYWISGTIADAHPAGLDGVQVKLEQINAPEYGEGLIELGGWMREGLPERPNPPEIPVAYAVVESTAKNALFQKRGDPNQRGAEVPRRWLSVFGGAPVPVNSGSGRRELADWVADHPLTSRVIVNRVWGWHFGKGIVATPNDFGARGDAPSHPQLLDWLAARFRGRGQSLKDLHRALLLTEAYQRASGAATEADPENRWLTHFSRRRLSAEEIRDSILAASGDLDLQPGESHPFPPAATWTFTQHAPFSAVYPSNKRSAFMMVQRQRRHPFLALFDGADPNASTPMRGTTTVPTQALYFMNDPFFHEQSQRLAQTLSVQTDFDARLQLLYQRVYQRLPTIAEHGRWKEWITQYPGSGDEPWAAIARVLLASNEFVHID